MREEEGRREREGERERERGERGRREGGREGSEVGFIEGRNGQPDLAGSRNGNAESPLKDEGDLVEGRHGLRDDTSGRLVMKRAT